MKFKILLVKYLYLNKARLKMNLSPIDNSNIRKKQISALTNPTHYLFDNNKCLDEINNFKSYIFI